MALDLSLRSTAAARRLEIDLWAIPAPIRPRRWCTVRMGDGARDAAVAALLRLADSSDVQDRIDAGRCLAVFADRSEARPRMLSLVLDADNTAVTAETAEALLRRHDEIGVRIMAEALADADDDHLNWIDAAARWVFLFQADHDAAVRTCRALLDDPDVRLRPGGGLLLELLAGISPPLQPADVGRSPLA
jgi:hypothetical protein